MVRRRRRRRRRPLRLFALLVAFFAALCLLKYKDIVLDWLQQRPPGIVIHHSASPPRVGGRIVDAEAIDQMHSHRGFDTWYKGKEYHIGYHFVILQDGTVQTGRPIGCRGAHTGKADYNAYIGICLVGDFSSQDNKHGEKGPIRPTRAQMNALVELCEKLMVRYHIDVSHVKRHRDLKQTACPGDRFPYGWLIARLSDHTQTERVATRGNHTVP